MTRIRSKMAYEVAPADVMTTPKYIIQLDFTQNMRGKYNLIEA